MDRIVKIIFIVFFSTSSMLFGAYVRDGEKSIVLDSSSLLVWQDEIQIETNTDNGDDSNITFDHNFTNAISYCDSLELGGYVDWRLPNYNELYNLADRTKQNPPARSDIFLEDVATPREYWTSTSFADSPTQKAWVVSFDKGLSGWRLKTDKKFVRCVRGSK